MCLHLHPTLPLLHRAIRGDLRAWPFHSSKGGRGEPFTPSEYRPANFLTIAQGYWPAGSIVVKAQLILAVVIAARAIAPVDGAPKDEL